MSEHDALAIARTAALNSPFAESMSMAKTVQRDGLLLWAVNSATIGSGFEVVIDDATGQVVNACSVGVR